jgi:hypothetical protein
MTNFEKNKAMSVEEFARWLAIEIGGECFSCPACDICIAGDGITCEGVLKHWLESEVEEDG